MYYKNVISSFLFILLFLSTIVNYDTKAELIGEIHTSEQMILAYTAQKIPIDVYHYSLENGEGLIGMEVVEEKIGTSINTRNYIKKITNYEFNKIHPEVLMVDENNRTINIYYKYIGEQVQEPDKDEDLEQKPDDDDGANKDEDLEQNPDKDEESEQNPNDDEIVQKPDKDENLPNEDKENVDKDNDNVHNNVHDDNSGNEEIKDNKDNDISTDEDGINNPNINDTEQSISKIPQTGLPVNLIQLGYIVLLAGIILFRE